MTQPVHVRELAPGASFRPFLDVAWTMNAGDPNWVPPLRLPLKALLDRRKHPFHQHADVAYFLAEQGGRVVGRVAAIVNHLHNEFHNERTGFFGFFESADDPAVSTVLLDTAAAWLRERGMDRVRGPMNLSTNEECGLLVDGFDTPPTIMMPHNPRYYPALLERWELRKAKDLLAIYIPRPESAQRLARGAERIAARDGATVRPLDMKRFRDEVALVKDIYNSAWERNWGFVPMTDAEFEHMASELKPVVDPDFCLFAEVKGVPVGFSLALPDLNQAIRHIPDGRLFPTGLLKLLWHRRRIDNVRILTLGFKPGYQHQGLGALFYLRTIETAARKGYRSGEASWILEDNWEMRRPMEKVGGTTYKTYRIYEKEL